MRTWRVEGRGEVGEVGSWGLNRVVGRRWGQHALLVSGCGMVWLV